MKELTGSKKVTAYGGEKESGASSAKPQLSRPRDEADDCSCMCQVEKNMSGIHSAHKKM